MTDSTILDDEYYDEATNDFPSVDDLVPLADKKNPDTVGRLVAIWARSNGTDKGENGDYGYTESITLVLDDGPDGDQFTDLIPSAVGDPIRLELRHSTAGVHSRLKPRVEGMSKVRRDPETKEVIAPAVPLKYRPLLGRMNTKASTKYKKGSPAVSISALSDADKVIVNQYADLIRSINKELEAKDKGAADAEAFE